MKTKKSALVERFTVRLNAELVSAIQKSGQSAADWLRQAARGRLDHEQPAATPATPVETAIASLIQHVAEVRRELVKRHQADAITQATLADLRKTLADIQRLQATFHTMLVKADENFSEGLDQLGRSLLDVVSPQVQAIVKAQAEPNPRPRPPVPPRTQL